MTVETFFANFGHLADASNGVRKLRELILQLAVQGKLVPQDPSDEPASVLMERIRAEKERQVKEGVIGKFNRAKTVTLEEQIFNVPENWVWSRLVEICAYIQRGKGPTYVEKSDVPVVSQRCVQWAGFTLAPARFICLSTVEKYAEERFLRSGDLLWNSTGTGTIGRINVYNHEDNPYEKVVADSHVTVVRPVFVSSRYVWIWLASSYIQADLEGNASGSTNQVELATSVVKAHVLPLPPLEEQKRIVAKVDQLMALCDELEARQQKQQQGRVRLNNAALDALLTAREPDEFADHWQRISTNFDLLYDHPETIAKLRAAILQLAVQGKLVPQDPSDEPASALLEKVNAERRKSGFPASIKGGNLNLILEVRESSWFPLQWDIAELADIALAIVDCPHSTPKWTSKGKLCVRTTQFKPGHLDLNNSRYVSTQTYTERIERLRPQADDILYSREGGILGVACRVPENVELCLGQRMMLFRSSSCCLPEYLELVLNSPLITEIARKNTTGGAAPRVNVATVKAYPIPVPPLEEQKRIVAKVDQLMALCDELESKLNQARQQSEKLMEATVRQVLGNTNRKGDRQPCLRQTSQSPAPFPKLMKCGGKEA